MNVWKACFSPDHPRIRGEHIDCATHGADHPRIRGEHEAEFTGVGGPSGSSPHTRGARQPFKAASLRDGIIPAYAGSTVTPIRQPFKAADHPRIRGEHLNRIKQEMPAEGSSPHTRGAPLHPLEGLDEARIIPAYAGSTWAS